MGRQACDSLIMTYATQQQLTDRYSEAALIALTDQGAVARGVVDVDVVARALIDTDAMIDGYLAARYSLPLAEVPPLLSDLAQTIAIWKLHRFEPDPKIAKDYDNALRLLRDIASGAVRLPIAGAEPAATGGTGVRITDRERPMTAENLKGFI